MEVMDTWMPIHILQKELKIKYMQIKFWGWGCSPSADDPAARCAQNFINKAVLWDYFYQFCSIFPHLVFFWYTPSLHFQVHDIYKVKAAPEPVWGSSALRESPVSCGSPATGGEDRQKAWKKADSFQEQKELFGVSSRFPTLSLACSTAPPPASLALPPQPQNSWGDGKSRAGHCYADTKGGGGKGWPCRHPSGTPADGRCRQLCPSVLPDRLGQVHREGQLQPAGTCGHVPKTQ